jgi:leader peptidase (prepilin peptidase)/N-methyltransferase
MSLREISLGIFLAISAIIDIKRKEVSIKILIVFGVVGLIFYIIGQPISLLEEVGGVVIGVLILLLYRITKGEIGEGDGWLLIVTGIFLGISRNFELLMSGLLLAAVCSLFLLLFKKAGKKKEIPFIPFLFLGYMGMVIL